MPQRFHVIEMCYKFKMNYHKAIKTKKNFWFSWVVAATLVLNETRIFSTNNTTSPSFLLHYISLASGTHLYNVETMSSGLLSMEKIWKAVKRTPKKYSIWPYAPLVAWHKNFLFRSNKPNYTRSQQSLHFEWSFPVTRPEDKY